MPNFVYIVSMTVPKAARRKIVGCAWAMPGAPW